MYEILDVRGCFLFSLIDLLQHSKTNSVSYFKVKWVLFMPPVHLLCYCIFFFLYAQTRDYISQQTKVLW